MKYKLDYESCTNQSLLFWIQKYIRNKLTNLSNSNVKDKDKLHSILQSLAHDKNDIEQLKILIKDSRNIGLGGIGTYFNPLYKLYYYIKEIKLDSLKQIDEDILSDFLLTVTSGLADASKKNHKIAIVNFFSYIDKNNTSSSNKSEENNAYVYNIELKNWGGLRGKSGDKLPCFMNKDEIYRFIDELEKYPFSLKTSARDKLIIKIILYTGIRVSEAINLRQKDMFLQDRNYVLQVRGKGNKPRVVMIKASIIDSELKTWKTQRNTELDILVCNQKGNPITQSYISRVVEKILLSAGIRKEKNGAHMLRHSFATLLYNKHHDLVLVQEALGHADINTSRIYTHFDTSKLEKTTDLF